jgi:DNA-binding CsgD family transcriptional regulator
MQLKRFYDLSQSTDVDQFESRLVEFANELGFGLVGAALVVDEPGSDAVFMALGNPPTEYAESSRSREDSLRDPVLARLKRTSVPFVYDQDTYVTAGAADLWETQAVYGYRTGVAVALHLPDFRHFILGLDRNDPLPGGDARLARLMADLQLMAVHAQDAAVRLLTQAPAKPPSPRLSAREIEILRWTMEGKSAWAVGELLSISEHTVNYYLRRVFQKLEVSSKHQAVLRALALGLL